MKKFLTTLAVLTVIASPAFAATHQHRAAPSSRQFDRYAPANSEAARDGFVGGRIGGGYGDYGGSLRGGFQGRYDPWVHWGSYYGPMVY
jgi:opacity protein-like surface antigen